MYIMCVCMRVCKEEERGINKMRGMIKIKIKEKKN